MDAGFLKKCHRELGHIVFDAKEKVTVRRISNNWDIDNLTAAEVMQKWIDEQKEKAKLSLEYIVRGVDKKGTMFMTLVKEDKLQNVFKLHPNCVKMLYSVEVASDIRPMNVSLDSEFNVKNLRLEPQKRQIEHRPAAPVKSEPVVVVKQEQKPGKKNLFATVSKPAAEPVKEEKASPPATPVMVKAEPQTPTVTKVSPKKQSPKKDTKKVVVNGKGSISSFFSSKPGQTAPTPKVANTGSTVKQEPESPASSTSDSAASQKQSEPAPVKPEPGLPKETARKRTISTDERSDEDQDVIPNTPQEKKREAKKRSGKPQLKRKKTANPSKKSRILEICDSSSDDEREAAEEQRKERLVDFDEEMAEPTVAEKQPSPSPEKPVENDSNSANRNRGKVKKMVTKTFTDDDGYLITVKEWEMVSEDESQENGTDKETSVASSVPVAKGKSTPASQGKAASGEKKETPPTPKTKQGSIMSFFAKK
uniref:DNA polymerase delta subunit 3 n=1 Tax=Anopheles atroparvus TaxID=41427 RepID=A0AAG5DDR4_ANOAO